MHGTLRAQGASIIDEAALNLLKKAMEKAKDKPRNEVFPLFRKLLSGNAAAQREIEWYFFANMYSYLTTNRNGRHDIPVNREVREAHTRQRVERIKQQIVLMKLMLPSGKLIEESTFGELAKGGAWLAKASKLGKPHQIVGKTVTEEQLRKCL